MASLCQKPRRQVFSRLGSIRHLCFLGDPRVHVVPGLASTQILFLREHNHIAAILGKINPHWDDEIIFQEARKVVIAINQHITYMEYLPLVVGHAHMKAYSLYSSPMGYATVYNPKADATMANAFGVAAFRFGHSQVPGDVALVNNHQQRAVLKVEETFNRPTTVSYYILRVPTSSGNN